MIEKLNKYEFFAAKNIIKEEIKKGNIPEITYYRDNENNPFTIYVVRKGMHRNGGDFHAYVAHAKRENLVKQKIEDIQKVIEMYKKEYACN